MDDVYNIRRRRNRPATSGSSQISETSGRARGRAEHPNHHSASFAMQTSTSTSQHAESSSSSNNSGGVTSKIMHNVRRSLSYGATAKKRDAGLANVGMQSTPTESLPPAPSRSPYAYHDVRTTSPTIEQIAMGLHISRTPHLRTSRAYQQSRSPRPSDTPDTSRSVSNHPPSRPSHFRRESAPAVCAILPPPPTRSSLKKTNPPSSVASQLATPSESNVSLSTLTGSTAPSTPRSSRSNVSMTPFSTRLQARMSRLLPSRKNSTSSVASAALTTSSDDDSASSELTPRKVVRFSALEVIGDDVS